MWGAVRCGAVDVAAIGISRDDRQTGTGQCHTDLDRDSRHVTRTALPGFELVPLHSQNTVSKLQSFLTLE